MDPADPEQLRAALSRQGALVGQHDQSLRDLSEQLQLLVHSVSTMGDRLSQLTAHFTPPAPPTPPVPEPPAPVFHVREPYLPAPERYAGALGKCKAFLMQCDQVFSLQPLTYQDDRAKIAYVRSLLTGSALAWASALWGTASPVNVDFSVFISEFRKVFDHPVCGRKAQQRLLSLRQGYRSVSEFAVEFRTLAAETKHNDSVLQSIFYSGLNENIKDELAVRDDTTNLDALVSLASRLDNRLRERRRERARHSTPGQPFPGPSRRPASRPSAPPRSPSPSPDSEEPMEMGRARVTPGERSRREREGLCFYCGQAGHLRASCPLRPKDQARQ
ncbi:hypothetical protein ANANG_G00016760 [Anguilla anguilla]|uniref:CCHC-type domain-containing protein n=1 Tax=Anguilla anguilla TaxID=7936 RepID=A0A9D3MXP6_ANGAN|nr:hypothetical protein ANANG_G00016760 [Anguilla anguilla]